MSAIRQCAASLESITKVHLQIISLANMGIRKYAYLVDTPVSYKSRDALVGLGLKTRLTCSARGDPPLARKPKLYSRSTNKLNGGEFIHSRIHDVPVKLPVSE